MESEQGGRVARSVGPMMDVHLRAVQPQSPDCGTGWRAGDAVAWLPGSLPHLGWGILLYQRVPHHNLSSFSKSSENNLENL